MLGWTLNLGFAGGTASVAITVVESFVVTIDQTVDFVAAIRQTHDFDAELTR